MANQLKVPDINAILTLHKSGHSKSEIGRMLGIHRETVAKYILLQSDPKSTEPDPRVCSGPASSCEPLREVIDRKLEDGLSGQRIYQDLRSEHTGSNPVTPTQYKSRRLLFLATPFFSEGAAQSC